MRQFVARFLHWLECGCGAWSIASDGEIQCACCGFVLRAGRSAMGALASHAAHSEAQR